MKFRIYKTIKNNTVIYIPKYKNWIGWWCYMTCSTDSFDKRGLYNKLYSYVNKTATAETWRLWPENKLGIYTTYDFVYWSPAAYATTYEGAEKIISMYTGNNKNDIEFINEIVNETVNKPIDIIFELNY